jgi:hypothetical protein
MRKILAFFALLVGAAAPGFAQTVYNPWTGKPDFVSTGTAGSGTPSTGTVTLDSLSLSNSYADKSYPLIVFDTVTKQGQALEAITTFYFEQSREAPRFVQSATNNPFVVDAATNPAYGLMSFSHSVSSESNCGYFPMPAVRDYNLSVDFRLDEFRVLNGTGTDSGAQRYVIAVASKTAGTTWLTANYTQSINVDMASGLGTVSREERSLATTTTLTNWNTVIASGVPWCVRVCRDGDDGTNDTSTVDSRFSMLTIRAGNTVP